jgi:hypothetical protein
VINLFQVPPARQFGVFVLALCMVWALAPRYAAKALVVALCGIALVLAASLALALKTQPLSITLVTSVVYDGSRYPLDMFWQIAKTTPVSLGLALVLLVARVIGLGGEWRAPERAAHVLWLGCVAWFGAIESGITINYLLLPTTFMLMAVAIDLSAISSRLEWRRAWMPLASAFVIVSAVGADQWRGEGSLGERLAVARPTIDIPGIEAIRAELQPLMTTCESASSCGAGPSAWLVFTPVPPPCSDPPTSSAISPTATRPREY